MAPTATTVGMESSEVEDLSGKLLAIEQLSVYRSCQAERCALEAADERRKLQARIAYLEPLYTELYDEYIGSCRLVEELEDALQKKSAAMERAEKRNHGALMSAQNEATLLKGRLKSMQNDLETIRTTTQSSAADLVAERNNAVGDLAAMQTEHQLLKERNNLLETEISDATKARDEAQLKLQVAQGDVTKLTKTLEALQKNHSKLEAESVEAKKAYTAEISSLKAQLEGSAAQLESTVKELENKHQTTVAELEVRLARPSSPDKRIPQLNESLKAAKAETTTLQAALNKERKSREAAERNLSKAREEWETQHKVLENKLESLRTKYKAEKEKNAAAAPGSAVNPRKRTIGPVLDFEPSAKKPRPLPTAITSEFSITPYLNRQRAAAAAGDVTLASDTTTSETAANTLANSKPTATSTGAAPTARKIFTEATKDPLLEAPRPLLAGANRKKKLPPKPAPEPVRDPILDAISEPEDINDDDEVGEDSMLNIILPTKTKKKAAAAAAAAGVNRKSATSKPTESKRARKPLLSDSPEPEEAPPVVTAPPPPPQPKSKSAAAAKPKPKPKMKKKTVGEASFIGGIRPTLFDDDDGTGRIQLNLDDGPSQETRKLGRNAPLLAPVNAFQREISPPKKRPGGLKMKFGAK